MSMNFAREKSLLRQRLQALGSADLAARREQQCGGETTFLGADDESIRDAATDLAAAYPQMGRAQMTAFVRTLWQSRIHELRAVGIELLAERAALLEPPDLEFLEKLLKDSETDELSSRLAGDVLGALVARNKKLWRDLRRFAGAGNAALQRAAVRACRLPLLQDATAFERFEELSAPLFAKGDAALLQALDDLLAAAAAVHTDAVRELAAKHGRKVKLPAKKGAAKPKVTATQQAPAKAVKAPARPKAPARKAKKKS